ncbi:MAG TPA: UPF0280 family protein [bacterium]|nr:UPF0280 family protein [bacterium]HOL35413.1 UPF0280 family protein [bacterium]HPP08808.1 UPF0280 family protein [bacterium]
MKYEQRFYRKIIDSELVATAVTIEESDLLILSEKDLSCEAKKELRKQRNLLKTYIKNFPEFYYSFEPVRVDQSAPEIVKKMSDAAFLCNVGPMATVAGAIADFVGRHLLRFAHEVIIENGGDIFLMIEKERIVAIFAGTSPFSLKIGIRAKPKPYPFGIATSSGTVGHSTSFGKADSVTVLCPSATIADGLATFMCNQTLDDDFLGIKNSIKNFPFLEGILVIKHEKLFAWGDIELVKI